jgi:L-lactate dehydrogenase complex protein LldG
MQNSSSRNNILQKIAHVEQRRSATLNQLFSEKKPILKPILPDIVTCFKAELEAVSGKCYVLEDEKSVYDEVVTFLKARSISMLYCIDIEICKKLSQYHIKFTSKTENFQQMEAGITGCEFLVARTGSVVVSSASESGRQMNVFPPIHIVVAKKSQLKEYPDEALDAIQKKYGNHLPSLISTITGPSRTADIEKTLVLGAHGPEEFAVFLSND